jgi:hypothetical protein
MVGVVMVVLCVDIHRSFWNINYVVLVSGVDHRVSRGRAERRWNGGGFDRWLQCEIGTTQRTSFIYQLVHTNGAQLVSTR